MQKFYNVVMTVEVIVVADNEEQAKAEALQCIKEKADRWMDVRAPKVVHTREE